jgi:hypothetical protein
MSIYGVDRHKAESHNTEIFSLKIRPLPPAAVSESHSAKTRTSPSASMPRTCFHYESYIRHIAAPVAPTERLTTYGTCKQALW